MKDTWVCVEINCGVLSPLGVMERLRVVVVVGDGCGRVGELFGIVVGENGIIVFLGHIVVFSCFKRVGIGVKKFGWEQEVAMRAGHRWGWKGRWRVVGPGPFIFFCIGGHVIARGTLMSFFGFLLCR